jgi:hypothetical protein
MDEQQQRRQFEKEMKIMYDAKNTYRNEAQKILLESKRLMDPKLTVEEEEFFKEMIVHQDHAASPEGKKEKKKRVQLADKAQEIQARSEKKIGTLIEGEKGKAPGYLKKHKFSNN